MSSSMALISSAAVHDVVSSTSCGTDLGPEQLGGPRRVRAVGRGVPALHHGGAHQLDLVALEAGPVEGDRIPGDRPGHGLADHPGRAAHPREGSAAQTGPDPAFAPARRSPRRRDGVVDLLEARHGPADVEAGRGGPGPGAQRRPPDRVVAAAPPSRRRARRGRGAGRARPHVSSIASLSPPTRVATTGSPSASASITATGSPSLFDASTNASHALITVTASARSPRRSTTPSRPRRRCSAWISASRGPWPTARMRIGRPRSRRTGGRGQQVRVVLLGPQVGDGADHHLVGREAELGADPHAIGAAADVVEIDPVEHGLGPPCEARRHRRPHQLRDRDVGGVGAHRPLVQQPRRAGEAVPGVVQRVHGRRPRRPRHRAGDDPADARRVRRVRVQHVDRVVAQLPAQPRRPPHVAFVADVEARGRDAEVPRARARAATSTAAGRCRRSRTASRSWCAAAATSRRSAPPGPSPLTSQWTRIMRGV